MVPDIVLLNVCVCEGRVNEFPRESLPKLFSYAVAALSPFAKRALLIHVLYR